MWNVESLVIFPYYFGGEIHSEILCMNNFTFVLEPHGIPRSLFACFSESAQTFYLHVN